MRFAPFCDLGTNLADILVSPATFLQNHMNSAALKSSSGPLGTTPRLSVIIATKQRHEMLARSVEAILRQDYPDFEVIVVDASPSACESLPADPRVRYFCLPDAPRNRNWQRNYGIARSTGAIAVLPDDDVIPADNWLANIASCYGDESVGGVGGRVIEGPDIPQVLGPNDPVAWTTWWGEVDGKFRAITPEPVDADHLKGCNVSFRLDLLKAIDGYDERIDGWAMRDETDVCLRIRRLGYRLIYSPTAVVEHFGFSQWTDESIRVWPAWGGYSGAKTTTYFVFKNLGSRAGFAWVLYHLYKSTGQCAKGVFRLLGRPPFVVAGLAAGLWEAMKKPKSSGLTASMARETPADDERAYSDRPVPTKAVR
jgi:glycosyltransferase involved in cell wall biosynthesis